MGILYSGSNAYIEQDLAQAFKWFEKSADQGHANAQFDLGAMYEEGIGSILEDDQNAKDWYQKAADQGHVLAKRRLCVLAVDCTLAAKFAPKSASGGPGPWILLCLIPYIQTACAVAVLGSM